MDTWRVSRGFVSMAAWGGKKGNQETMHMNFGGTQIIRP